MKFQFMAKHQTIHSVAKMARILRVSRSGYYSWAGRSQSTRVRKNIEIREAISAIQTEIRYRYGARRITHELNRRGYGVNHKRGERLMKEHGLQARRKKRCRSTTNSQHEHPVADHVLDRRFDVAVPDTVYVSDITYLPTAEGWMYLCTVLDLASRKVVGWAISRRMTADVVVAAITAAVLQQRPPRGVLFHSDRGSQYCSRTVRATLQRYGFIPSMSRKGNCWDNAPAESFFKTLKAELCGDRPFRIRTIARAEVFEYIEIFYNRKRLHSSIGYITPMEYEAEAARRAA